MLPGTVRLLHYQNDIILGATLKAAQSLCLLWEQDIRGASPLHCIGVVKVITTKAT